MALNRPPDPPSPPSPQPPFQWKPANLWLLMLAMVAVFWMRDLWVTATQVQPIPYSEFLQHLKAGRL